MGELAERYALKQVCIERHVANLPHNAGKCLTGSAADVNVMSGIAVTNREREKEKGETDALPVLPKFQAGQ
jgi:hypothetical protein